MEIKDAISISILLFAYAIVLGGGWLLFFKSKANK